MFEKKKAKRKNYKKNYQKKYTKKNYKKKRIIKLKKLPKKKEAFYQTDRQTHVQPKAIVRNLKKFFFVF